MILLCSEIHRDSVYETLSKHVGHETLPLSNTVKILRIILDVRFRFIKYINSLIEKIYLGIHMLYANKYLSDKFKQITESLVVILNYVHSLRKFDHDSM